MPGHLVREEHGASEVQGSPHEKEPGVRPALIPNDRSYSEGKTKGAIGKHRDDVPSYPGPPQSRHQVAEDYEADRHDQENAPHPMRDIGLDRLTGEGDYIWRSFQVGRSPRE